MKFYFTLFLLGIFTIGFSQTKKQTCNWYFGDGAGLSFISGVATPITGSTNLNPVGPHAEGTSAISDSAGKLLFYSNGETVWDNTHQVMQNGSGLLGGLSSSQSSIIIPQPGNSRYYYLFTTDAFFENGLKNGFRYNLIDMCANNGLGAIDNNGKNILLMPNSNEKITAVRHANGKDIWIIAQRFYTNYFHAYLLTEFGITDSVISASGTPHGDCQGSNITYGAIGWMKANNRGTKLVIVNGQSCTHISEMHDFDKSTGIVSNAMELEVDPTASTYYGVAFSPDDTKLYATTNLPTNLYQFDVSSNNINTIRSSKISIATSTSANYWALQLGMDGRIYMAHRFTSFISVVTSPNKTGAACDFYGSALWLGGKLCSMGLPNFMAVDDYENKGQVYCKNVITIDTSARICHGDSFLFFAKWLKAGGVYRETKSGSSTDTIYRLSLAVDSLPQINLGKDTTLCTGSYSLQVPVQYTAHWSTGESTNSISIDSDGLYVVTVTDTAKCKASDNILVLFKDCSISVIDTSSGICRGDSFNFFGNWLVNEGIYRDTVVENNTNVIYRLQLSVFSPPQINLGNDTIVCADSYILEVQGNYNTLWSTGETSASIRVIKSGEYIVSALNGLGCIATDTIGVSFGCGFSMPDVFTPNGDSKNDFFFPVIDLQVYSVVVFKVYNIWGQMVYEAKNDAKGWDGKFKSIDQNTGSYLYIIEVSGIVDQHAQFKIGSFSLIR